VNIRRITYLGGSTMVAQPIAIEMPAVGFARTVSQTSGQR
jgi:hypothetical protein